MGGALPISMHVQASIISKTFGKGNPYLKCFQRKGTNTRHLYLMVKKKNAKETKILRIFEFLKNSIFWIFVEFEDFEIFWFFNFFFLLLFNFLNFLIFFLIWFKFLKAPFSMIFWIFSWSFSKFDKNIWKHFFVNFLNFLLKFMRTFFYFENFLNFFNFLKN